MQYEDFGKNFIERTQKNLEEYQGEYDVTSLINNCLGLIIIPKQSFTDNLPNLNINEYSSIYHIGKDENKIEDTSAPIDSNRFSLKNIVRHIRNAISHGRIEEKVENEKIIGVRLYDKKNDTSEENFSIEMTIEEFKSFSLAISNDFLNGNT
jgi:hypothetical protein